MLVIALADFQTGLPSVFSPPSFVNMHAIAPCLSSNRSKHNWISVCKSISLLSGALARSRFTRCRLTADFLERRSILFTLMRAMQILNDAQYNEFTEYLMQSTMCESRD